MITPDEAVRLAERMRAAGVQRFVLTPDRFTAVLLPPAPGPVTDLAARIGELTPDQRTELLEQAKREFDQDIYGASQ